MQQTIRVLKSPWLSIGVLVALAAFVAGYLNTVERPSRVVAQERTPVNTPDLSKIQFNKHELTPITITVSERPVRTATSSGHQKSIPGATTERTIYFHATDRTIYLPDDVEYVQSITAITCFADQPCPKPTIHILQRGADRVALDGQGNVIPYWPETNPDAFPFLNED